MTDDCDPNAYGEDGQADDRPMSWTELVRFAVDDVLDGYAPMSCEPLDTATVDRQSGRDGDLLGMPWRRPADDDGGSPFWRSVPRVRLNLSTIAAEPPDSV